PADIYVRYRRMCGDSVHFVCGADEHGVAITLKAEKANLTYEEYVDHWHREIQRTLEGVNIGFDLFSGTAAHRNPHHAALAQQFFVDLKRNGYLEQRSAGEFCSEALDRFPPGRYIEGTCHTCSAERGRGDRG